MPWEHARYCGLGMDAIVIVCSRNTNIIMVWAWMLWLSFALGTRALPWFGHGCAIVCSRNTNVIMVWAWPHYFWYAFGTRTFLWFGRGCAIVSMLSEPPMPLFIVCSVCSRNTNVIMVWAWSHYFWYAFGTRTLFWFGHGCTIYRRLCYRMLSEHEHYYGLGMDAR